MYIRSSHIHTKNRSARKGSCYPSCGGRIDFSAVGQEAFERGVALSLTSRLAPPHVGLLPDAVLEEQGGRVSELGAWRCFGVAFLSARRLHLQR